jgi:hypothetical protein
LQCLFSFKGGVVDLTEKIEFIATLVYEKFPGWRTLESHIITASHPETAYNLALARGEKGLGDKRFVGLAELKVKKDDRPPFGRLEKGEADDLIIEKANLAAFQDSRWIESEG